MSSQNDYTMPMNVVSTKFEADEIEYSSLDFAEVLSQINTVMESYALMRGCYEQVAALGIEGFRGEAADSINILIEALPKYLDDFEHTVEDFVTLVDKSDLLVKNIPNSSTFREIKNI